MHGDISTYLQALQATAETAFRLIETICSLRHQSFPINFIWNIRTVRVIGDTSRRIFSYCGKTIILVGAMEDVDSLS